MSNRALLQQALEALEDRHLDSDGDMQARAITALRERLAQPEQEPATYQSYGLMGGDEFVCSSKRNITG